MLCVIHFVFLWYVVTDICFEYGFFVSWIKVGVEKWALNSIKVILTLATLEIRILASTVYKEQIWESGLLFIQTIHVYIDIGCDKNK